jgi:hypothetical protein
MTPETAARLAEITRLLADLRHEADELARERADLMREAATDGTSQNQLADASGLAKSRVSQILNPKE